MGCEVLQLLLGEQIGGSSGDAGGSRRYWRQDEDGLRRADSVAAHIASGKCRRATLLNAITVSSIPYQQDNTAAPSADYSITLPTIAPAAVFPARL